MKRGDIVVVGIGRADFVKVSFFLLSKIGNLLLILIRGRNHFAFRIGETLF